MYIGLTRVEEFLSMGLVTIKLSWQSRGRGSSGWGGSDGIYFYRDCWRSRGGLLLSEEFFKPLETV